MTDASGTTTYAYDSADRLTSKVTPEGTLSYTYDSAGHLASMTSSNAHGVSVDYQYDDLNRLSAVIDNRLSSGANTTSYTYDSASNVGTVTYPNGVQSTFTYDTLNRVSDVSSQVSGYTYQRGPTGNLTAAGELNGRTLLWNYDGIYRLTNETIGSAPSGANGSVSYTLDPVGNRTSDTSSLPGVTAVSGTYNAYDEVSSETYDNNGNATHVGTNTFAYDAENHLTSMNSGSVTLIYDGDGNRVAKIVGGVTTSYLVDDLNPTGYPQVVEELTGGSVTRQYTYGLQRISQNQVIDSAWTPSFYEYDGGGNVRQLTSAAGAVTDSYEYDAFGNKINSTGTTPNVYLYRGEQYDPDLGLYYLRARYYNPITGRFLSRDPEDGSTLAPKTLHKYIYAGGDPVDLGDPTGRAVAGTMPGRVGVGGALGEYVILTLQATAAAVAVADVGCAVSTAYYVLARKLAFDANITTGDCEAKGEGRMRIQLQLEGTFTSPFSQILTNDDPPGVTTAQVRAGLLGIWGEAQIPSAGFPYNSQEGALRTAIIEVSQCLNKFPPNGYGFPKRSLCSAPVGTSGWRVDLDNLNGTNLRQ